MKKFWEKFSKKKDSEEGAPDVLGGGGAEYSDDYFDEEEVSKRPEIWRIIAAAVAIILMILALLFSLKSCATSTIGGEHVHEYIAEVTKPATCTEDGIITYTCVAGDDSYQETIEAKGHTYVLEGSEDPTCTEAGYERYVCSECGDVHIEEIAPTGHTKVEIDDPENPVESDYVSDAKQPTCEEDGYIIYICPEDGDTFVEVLPALGHNYVPETVREATCTEGGLIVYTCTVCGDSYSETVSALGHDYVGVVTKEPACEDEGVMTYTCSRCGDSYTIPVSATGHDYQLIKHVDATDDDNGYDLYACSVCGDSYIVEIAALGHRWDEGKLVKEATCTEAGSILYTCLDCGKTYEEVIPAFGHTVVVDPAVDPTCTETGLTEGSHCSVCNIVLVPQQTLPAKGHAYVGTVTKPTCTEGGYTTYVCSVCGDTYVGDYTAPLGHSITVDAAVEATCTETGLTEGSHCPVCGEVFVKQTVTPALGHDYKGVVTDPTCTEKGYTTYTCTRCGDSYVGDYVEPLGHDYVGVVTDPTCTEQGYTTYTCTRCEGSYVDNYVDALGHNYDEKGVCEVCGDTFATEGLEYKLNGNGQSYSLVGLGTVTDEEIYIAETYEGLPVTGISSTAFASEQGKNVTKIVVSSSITDIAEDAFDNCSSLTEILVRDENTAYVDEDGVLFNYDKTILVRYPSAKEGEAYVVPVSVIGIANHAFYNSDNLVEVTLSDSLERIGNYAFYDCDKIEKADMPNSVVSVGEYAYASCDRLVRIVIGEGVTSLGDYAYYDCPYVLYIDYNAIACEGFDAQNYVFGSDGLKDAGITVTIGDKVTIIPSYMFASYGAKIVYLNFGSSSVCTTVDTGAFYDCDYLTNFALGSAVTTIGAEAFAECDGITGIVIPQPVTSIGYHAYYNCANVSTIDYYAVNCSDLLTASASNYAFDYVGRNTSGVKATIHATAERIPGYLFNFSDFSVSYITSVVFEEGSVCEEVGVAAFRNCPFTSIVLPDSVRSIGAKAFEACLKLSSVTFGSNVETIGDLAFSGCRILSNIVVPASVVKIGQYAFSGCVKGNITFADCGGWYITTSDGYTGGTSVDVTDPAVNTVRLTTYADNAILYFYLYKKN